jgi:hypothetical protein
MNRRTSLPTEIARSLLEQDPALPPRAGLDVALQEAGILINPEWTARIGTTAQTGQRPRYNEMERWHQSGPSGFPVRPKPIASWQGKYRRVPGALWRGIAESARELMTLWVGWRR